MKHVKDEDAYAKFIEKRKIRKIKEDAPVN